MPRLSKLVVVGVGLIGGSAALALKAAGAVGEVLGVGRSATNLQTALNLGVLDRVETDPARAVAGADMVLIATPVGQMPAIFKSILPALPAHAILTDAGSTKGDVVACARAHLGDVFPRFVPGHPIAGAEHSGAGAARADLYQNKKVVLTPVAETDPAALDAVRTLWQACGADVRQMSPEAHDGVFAAVSHLPHLLAFALVEELAKRENAELFFDFAASGFRDFTRIASSHPEMWRDIALANQTALLAELDAYQAQLTRLRGLLANSDAAGLDAVFETARNTRNDWLARR